HHPSARCRGATRYLRQSLPWPREATRFHSSVQRPGTRHRLGGGRLRFFGFPSLDPRLGMKCSILVRLPPPHEISPVVLKSPKTRSRSLGSQKTAREEMPKPFSPYIENPFMKLVSKLDSPFPIPVNRGG